MYIVHTTMYKLTTCSRTCFASFFASGCIIMGPVFLKSNLYFISLNFKKLIDSTYQLMVKNFKCKKKSAIMSKLIVTLGVCQFDFLQFFKRPWLQNQYLILTLCVNYYILLRICYSQQIQSKSSKNQYYIFRNSYYCQQTQTVDCLFRLYFTLVQCLQTGFAFSEKAKLILSTC